jgi:hypothetical protein
MGVKQANFQHYYARLANYRAHTHTRAEQHACKCATRAESDMQNNTHENYMCRATHNHPHTITNKQTNKHTYNTHTHTLCLSLFLSLKLIKH